MYEIPVLAIVNEAVSYTHLDVYKRQPVNYYKSLLSTKKDNYAIYADSTFASKKRLLALATDVSTRYTRRSRSCLLYTSCPALDSQLIQITFNNK